MKEGGRRGHGLKHNESKRLKEMRLKVRDCQLICQLSWALFIITRFSFFIIITIQCGVVLSLDFGGNFLRLIREGKKTNRRKQEWIPQPYLQSRG